MPPCRTKRAAGGGFAIARFLKTVSDCWLVGKLDEGRSVLSRYCHGSRGKILENGEQKMNMEEKLALALHRNFLILLGKPPLRRIMSN
jgi:hypothetical protein